MTTLKMRACMAAGNAIADEDRDALLARAAEYEGMGLEPNAAAAAAAEDILAEVELERTEFMDALREQHADLFEEPKREEPKAEAKPDPVEDGQPKATPAKIVDAGEKIGGARKDTATSGATAARGARDNDERPTWAKRFHVSQIIASGAIDYPDQGRWVINDSRMLDWRGQARQVGKSFATKEEAEAFVPIAAVSLKHHAVPVASGRYEIWRTVSDRKRVKVLDQQFDTRDDAMRYMAEHAVELLETNTTFGEADLPLPPDRAREGVKRRDGDVAGEDFQREFGLRGVEFGNWNNQVERQGLMNDAFDALMDLADVLGVPPKAIGLNGDLALAFGARGHGLNSARAHYEMGRAVINLTKERGAGSLAHEWFHAMDHYLARQDGKSSAQWVQQEDGTRTLKARGAEENVSHGFGRNSGVRAELRAAYDHIIATMTKKATEYTEDTAKADTFTARARDDLARELDSLRKELAAQKDERYYKRNNKPASAEQLAEFDAVAKRMLDGEAHAVGVDRKSVQGQKTIAHRWTNDSLESISGIYKAVRGRAGFDSTNRNGVMDRLADAMRRYSARLKMLADAQTGAEKSRMVPTEFAMNAKELDQGRGGDYWTTPHEMAARAFQGYVEDRVADRGGVSRFLNYAPENAGILTPWGFKRPYPTGQERAAINKAFDAFVAELKTRETDQGVAMFDRGGLTDREAAAIMALPQETLDRLLGRRLTATRLQAIADGFGAVPIKVAQSVNDMPATERKAVLDKAPDGKIRGAYFKGSDTIWLVADNLHSEAEAMFVAMHEAFHRGLAKTIGPEAKKLLRAMRATNGKLRKLTQEQMERHGIGEDEAIEEALADLAGKGEARDLRGWQKLVTLIRNWLGKLGASLGFDIKWSDDMIADFVAGTARAGLQGGVRVNAAEDGGAGSADGGSRNPPSWLYGPSPLSRGNGAPDTTSLQAESQAFKRWFAGSKIVDKHGRPQVLYHGTQSNFSEFELASVRGEDIGIWLTDSELYADWIAHLGTATSGGVTGRRGRVASGRVMRLFAKIENPMRFDILREGVRVADEIGVASPTTATEAQRILSGMQGWNETVADLVADAKSRGHDGLILENFEDNSPVGPTTTYLVFDPSQVKSAIDNRGTFDPGSADITLSRAAQDLLTTDGGVFDFNRLGATRQDRIRTVVDGARPFWLGALTRDQIADVYGKDIPPVKEYDTLTRAMENQRSKIAQDADTLYSEWSKLGSATNDKLARVMLDATVHSVHPDGAYADITGADNAERQRVHARISREFQALPKDAQAMYRRVRDFHAGMLEQLKSGLEQRIERQVQDGKARAATLTSIRQAFDKYKESGPYFPLSRFGDFLVIGTRADGERVVASYETAGEQATAARALRKDGFTVKMKTAKDYSRSLDGSAGKFAGDVLTMLNDLDMAEATVGGKAADLKSKLMDDVNQLFIRALPDLSYRKHFAHRKNTPGFSSDVMRGFASSAFHAASHIARLNHADQMTFALEDAFKTIDRLDDGDFNQQTQVLNELAQRHDAAMNPNTHPIAAMLNQVGFVMYLGASPAAGLVNLLQTPMVTLPYLGARHGFGKATAAMGKATKDIMGAKANRSSGWNAADSPKLTDTERATMRKLQDEGVIDLTQAHDLSAATGLDTGNVARSKAAFAMSRAMKIVGWTFHVPEVMNRQVTALTAYRLEMQASGDQAKAEDAAREAIKRTHFDYSASNRARYMQGNVARVMLQFKQYAQNMTYLLGRAAHQAMKGETEEVRSIARRQLVATLAATFTMAGALGLPGLGAAAGLIGMLVGALDDDDKPWEWKVELRNLLADTFGKEAGEVLAHGLPRALMPWDLAGRVGMGDLWFRSNDREGQSPREAFATDLANILGPTAGTLLGLYTASDHMARGNWSKAAESMVPKFIRDPIQAGRIATEGITSYTGDHLMDVTGAEALGKLLGFSPARAAEMYEGRNAVKNAETAVMERRQYLIGKAARARMAGDTEEAAEAMRDIATFNRRNPREAIKGATIAASIMARRRHERQTQDGTFLPKNRDHLRDVGRFAAAE
jgi:hypothetical protein